MSFGSAALALVLPLAVFILGQADDETIADFCQEQEKPTCAGHILPVCINASWMCPPSEAGADGR